MFCNQCEQARGGKGCVQMGVCGKDPDVQALQDTLLYGLKGMAAYAHHARRLGATDDNVNAFIEEALFATMTNVNFDVPTLLELVLDCGRHNLRVMQMLDEAHTRRFGTPSPTKVHEGTRAGPGILVTGHDLLDLLDLLEQTKGTGINVYTHGEMLPAHMYPELRKYPHLAGHYGGAWQRQRSEFAEFTGPILATTNCVMIPRDVYQDRLFTTRATAVPGGKRLKTSDFSEVIAAARRSKPLVELKVRESTIGFHHNVLLGLADKIVDAVKAGDISRFYLIGGCDGHELERNYYADFARNTAPNSVILTLGCGKFRIREHDYGTLNLAGVGAVPRLMDMGQCNDSYGAIQVAVGLAQAFNCSVNELPLTIVLSWFEQKAVAVLLTLLYLGVKNIRIGPAAPAWITPNVLGVLQQNYGLKLIGDDPLEDLKASLSAAAC